MPKKISKKEFLKTPKGTRDIMPHDVLVLRAIESKAGEIAEAYGFKPIRTPHIEHAEIFSPTLGETSDIVEKQMYSFKTRGGDNLVLRPEWTVPAVRVYFEHGMQSWTQPVMFYTFGSFFRHENPQRGRFREFEQFDLEVLGDESSFSDALVIRAFALIFQEMGLKNFIVHINTLGDKECRADFRKELLAYYRRKINSLCKNCRQRLKTNPLRLLDCKEPSCVEVKADAPKTIDFSCQSCRAHFKSVLELLDELNVPYFLDPHLVRGLDYYSRTVFEIFLEASPEKKKESGESKEPEGAENPADKKPTAPAPVALAAGGRYDYLAENLGQKKLFGVGGALGVDRLAEELAIRGLNPVKEKKPDVSLIQIGPQAKKKTLAIFESLRKAKFSLTQSFSKDNLRQQLQLADKAGSATALIIGQKEALDGTAIVRDMISGAQETVLQEKVVDYLKKKSKIRN
ncbi:MAG: histidine--tRNA ligase [Candidatus Niyogibacteria bacterium]|nr:MAG: histidine--tRNA ligase [Candidatus Niyogibacteria bacterium]